MNRWTPATLGLAGVAASTIAADIWAANTGRPTISAAVARLLEHPVASPIVIGALSGLGWHLAVDPIIRRLERTSR